MELWHNSRPTKFPWLIKQGTHAFVYGERILPSTPARLDTNNFPEVTKSSYPDETWFHSCQNFRDSELTVGGCRWSSFSSSPVATLWEFPGLKFWSQAELPSARTSLSWGGRELSWQQLQVRKHRSWCGLGCPAHCPQGEPWAPWGGSRGWIWTGQAGLSRAHPLLPAPPAPLPPPAGGPLAPSSPPKIGLTANRQSLPSFTAGDLWPIARGFFARSRKGRPIGAVPRPRLGVGQGCGGGWGVSRGTG